MAFNLRSGNASAFKSMGSSPAKKHVKGHNSAKSDAEYDADRKAHFEKKDQEFIEGMNEKLGIVIPTDTPYGKKYHEKAKKADEGKGWGGIEKEIEDEATTSVQQDIDAGKDVPVSEKLVSR